MKKIVLLCVALVAVGAAAYFGWDAYQKAECQAADSTVVAAPADSVVAPADSVVAPADSAVVAE
jgi:hypothetical protein